MRDRTPLLSILILLLVVGTAGWAADGGTWVSDDGETHSLHGRAHLLLADGDGEVFDVSELADGETRTFGDGGKQITATRQGDRIVLATAGPSGSREIVCRIDRDRCQVVTFDEEPGKLMLIAKKVSTCEPGDDDCEGVAVVDVDVEVLGGDAHGWVHADKGVRGLKMLGDGDEVLLRCPEGDTTMHVALDEADDTFLCPKHSVPLEKARGPVIRTIRIETTAGESAD